MIDSREAIRTVLVFLKQRPNKKERTHERDLSFSQYLRQYCRPSAKSGCKLDHISLDGFVAFDLDFVLWDYKRRVLQLLEVKTHKAGASGSQRETFKALDQTISAGAPLVDVTYLGLHYLRMDGTTPKDSTAIWWDDKPITKEECWRLINMIDFLEQAA